MCRAGRRIKVCFDSNEKGELVAYIKQVELGSKWAKHSTGGEWLAWEQSTPKRPAQALKELVFLFRDLGWVENADLAAWAAEYWVKDMDLTRTKRLESIDKLIK